jgi:hypothetical protein
VRNTPCSEDFDIWSNGNLYIYPFYKVSQDNEQLRKTKEDYFMKVFHPKLNR